ncbi:MAG: EamA family transporter [Roseovarius pacificus]|nr:EamA family transporter [Roseovarius pacificus]
MRMTYRDWVLLLLLSVLWGGSFFFVAVAVREVPPLTVVGLRTGIAALALGAVLWIRGETCSRLPKARLRRSLSWGS